MRAYKVVCAVVVAVNVLLTVSFIHAADEMRTIPASYFQMGDTAGTGNADERPVHYVRLNSFKIDRCEVSKAQWDQVRSWALTNGYTDLAEGWGGASYGPTQCYYTNHPVVQISWYDCIKWCNARSEKEQHTPVYYTSSSLSTVYRTGMLNISNECANWNVTGYRLPTEAEWEKACRGGILSNSYPWGSTLSGDKANYWYSGDPYDNGTTPVAYYKGSQVPAGTDMTNGYDLYDIIGNVQEYCWDWYDSAWYSSTGSSSDNTHGPVSGTERLVRGGSWDHGDVGYWRSANRAQANPTVAYCNLGFRTVQISESASLVITSIPATVAYEVTLLAIAGTNAGVIGMLWASNDANSLVYTFPAEQAWITPGIALEVGANPIYVCGTSAFDTVVSDCIIITRLPAGTSPPYLDVTSTPVTVSYDQTACAIAGTNNVNVVGTLAWSNVTTQTGGSLPAALTWSIADIAVAVGANTLVVVGTNAYGARAQDSVVVTRGDIGTGAPFIDITNSIIDTLSYDTTMMVLGGTNNPHVVGNIWWSNVTANVGGMATRAGQAWRATVQLRRSPDGDTVNTIVVYGTNAWQQQAVDGIEISVAGQGTGAPFVDITNAVPPALSYDVTSYTLGITNNMQVVGWMWWTNQLTGFSGHMPVASFAARISSILLGVGANVIMVTGTNEWNVSASDTITITRGGIGTGAPFVDITNVLAGPVNNAVNTFTVAGTNNPQVVGTMWWINAADDSRGAFAASPSWQADVPLQVGLNMITVWGTNLWTVLTSDSIAVMRLPGAPANVSATDGALTNIVRITFAASVGATKYMVYRAPGNAPTNFTGLSSEITATTYDDATVAAGQQYYYAVQAGSPYGWSALSASDSGFALFAINAGEWKYKAGAKANKKGKMTGKDILKGSQVNPALMPYFAQGWRIGLAGLVNGSLTNWNGPYSLTPNKSQKLWQVKDPAKGTPKVCLIKYRVNDKKGDKLDYQLWTNMPANKVVYILPTNLLFGTATLLNEQDTIAPPVQFRLQPTGKVDKQGWQPLDATVIGVQ